MAKRSRIVAFCSAGLLVVAGGACAIVLGDETGQVLALVLIGLGLVLATSLVFLEIGLSEDRARAREPKRRSPRRPDQPARGGRTRLERMRGRPRRLK